MTEAAKLGMRALSRRFGISMPALKGWLANGDLPAPAGHDRRGWPYWTTAQVETWLNASAWPQCPVCGVKTKRPRAHAAWMHPDQVSLAATGFRPDRPEWMSAAEIASEVQMTVQWARHLIQSGQLPARQSSSGEYKVERLMWERWLLAAYSETEAFIAANSYPARDRRSAASARDAGTS